jgi:hypothetical protein
MPISGLNSPCHRQKDAFSGGFWDPLSRKSGFKPHLLWPESRLLLPHLRPTMADTQRLLQIISEVITTVSFCEANWNFLLGSGVVPFLALGLDVNVQDDSLETHMS